MNYFKITAKLTPYNKDAADILAALLAKKGFESFEDMEDGVAAYIKECNYTPESLAAINIPFPQIEITFNRDLIPSQNWNIEWEKNYFQPIDIKKRYIVRSPFHSKSTTIPNEIIIQPKMSFGTGHHETTSMMMEFILESDIENKKILDMGCGTAILSIMASMEGASKITAIDIDPWCIKNSKENCQLNNIDNIEIIKGNSSTLLNKAHSFDIIMANINRNILLEDIPSYVKALKLGGQLILSGFYNYDIEEIDKCAKKNNLSLKKRKEHNQWSSIAYELNEK
ncbi:50S ribosomal protein L11 methyltransferase [Marinilabiliaceae bacterium ANBcel2]|nr:50S ribosomal protein L11 methyltransferase [Marinilabiliaceae bacterium ANBcel2]